MFALILFLFAFVCLMRVSFLGRGCFISFLMKGGHDFMLSIFSQYHVQLFECFILVRNLKSGVVG